MNHQSPVDLTLLPYSYKGDFTALLPLGVLTLSSFRGLPSPSPLAPDNWNWAPPLPWVSSRRGSLECELEFLSQNDFIRATYSMVDPGFAKLRIYICPEDAGFGITRELRTELRGRALLKKIWGMVDANPKSWGSLEREWNYRYQYASLAADIDDSLTLQTMFNSLPSPEPDLRVSEDAPTMVRELLESVLEDDGVPGFKSQLYHYQRQSVWKMLQRELVPQKRLDPRHQKWIGPTGVEAWINMDDMTFFRKQNRVDDIRGGILCEEMGTGKTVPASPECD
jgi:hypothetical protein